MAKGAKIARGKAAKIGLVKPLKVGITRLFGVQRLTELHIHLAQWAERLAQMPMDGTGSSPVVD